MKLAEAKAQFIASWGAMGTHWGINRTMAQIHALLLITAQPLTQDGLMEQLEISRGNVNTNVRELISWGLVDRILIPGERKEYFTAEKDMWKVATLIMKERKKRELDPLMKMLTQVENVEGGKEAKQFTETMGNIRKMGEKADKVLGAIIKAEESWLTSTLVKMLK